MSDKGTTPAPRGDVGRPKTMQRYLAQDYAIMKRDDGEGEPTTVRKDQVPMMVAEGWRRVN